MVTISEKLKALDAAVAVLENAYAGCYLCPRRCGINRARARKGHCAGPDHAVLYTSFLHRGEEPCISGTAGSGTLFFSGCSLRCSYCQNYKFSQSMQGEAYTDEALAAKMLLLQKEWAANINLVTPTHFLPSILKALRIAYRQDLRLPVVYNTSGYELASILRLLRGIIDIYLVDIKYTDAFLAEALSTDIFYPSFAQGAFRQMYEQAHHFEFEKEMMRQGVILRHLVLPSAVENTLTLLRWLEENRFTDCFLSLMFQYRPYFKATEFPDMNRVVSKEEHARITDYFYTHCRHLAHGWIQELNTDDSLAGIHFEPKPESNGHV